MFCCAMEDVLCVVSSIVLSWPWRLIFTSPLTASHSCCCASLPLLPWFSSSPHPFLSILHPCRPVYTTNSSLRAEWEVEVTHKWPCCIVTSQSSLFHILGPCKPLFYWNASYPRLFTPFPLLATLYFSGYFRSCQLLHCQMKSHHEKGERWSNVACNRGWRQRVEREAGSTGQCSWHRLATWAVRLANKGSA